VDIARLMINCIRNVSFGRRRTKKILWERLAKGILLKKGFIICSVTRRFYGEIIKITYLRIKKINYAKYPLLLSFSLSRSRNQPLAKK